MSAALAETSILRAAPFVASLSLLAALSPQRATSGIVRLVTFTAAGRSCS